MFRIISLIVLLSYIGSEFFFQKGSHQLQLLLFLIWLATASLYPKWKIGALLNKKRYAFIFVFIVFYFVSTFFGSNLYKATTSTLYMTRVFAPVLMYDIIRQETIKTKQFITWVLLAIMLGYAVMANVILGVLGFDQGLRGAEMMRGEDLYFETMFSFIYLLPILTSTLIITIKELSPGKKWKDMLLRLVLISITGYLFILTIRSLFMTVIIVTIGGALFALLFRNNNTFFKTMLQTSLVMVALVVVFLLGYESIHVFAEERGNVGIVQRIEEVRDAISGDVSRTSDLGSRNYLRTVSFMTFLSHPLFGVNHQIVGIIDESIVGNHAQWVDDLARYGLFSFFMFFFLYYVFKKQFRDTKTILPILLYISIGFLNPLLSPCSSINIFLLVPLVLDSFRSSVVLTENSYTKLEEINKIRI